MSEKYACDPERSKIAIYKGKEIDFDSSLAIAGYGKFNVYITLCCGLSLFAINTTLYAIGYILPSAECDLHLSTSDKGLLAGVGFVGVITTLYIWGALADAIGRKKVILVSLFGTFLTSVFAAFTANFWIFTILLFLNGVSISGASSTTYAYLGEFHNNDKRTSAVQWCTIFVCLALLALPAFAWISLSQTFALQIIITFLPWRLFLLLCNFPALFAGLSVALLPESPKYLVLKGKIPEAVEIIKKIYKVNKSQDFLLEPLKHPVQQGKFNLKKVVLQTASLFKGKHLKNTVVTCLLQFGSFGISSGLLLWYPDLLDKMSEGYKKFPNSSLTVCEALTINGYEFDAEESDCLNATVDFSVYQQNIVIGVAYLVGQFTSGFLVDCVGKKILLVANLLITGICCVILTFVTAPLLVDILFVIILVPPGLCVPIITAAVVDIFPTQFKAIAVSLCLLMGRLGSVVITSLVGYFLQISCDGAFYMSAVLCLGCIGLSVFIPDKSYS